MANQSIYSAFERFWQHVVSRINNKAEVNYVDEQITTVQNKIGEVPEGKTVIDLIGEGGTSDDAVKKSGDTMTGALTLAGDPTEALHAATKKYVDDNKNSGTITEVQVNGTSIATSGTADIPAASTSAYGVTKLSSSISDNSTTTAATPSAVKLAYDLANTANTTANAALPTAGGTMTGVLTTQNNTSYTTKQARNIFLIAEGTSMPSGSNGDICLVYAP